MFNDDEDLFETDEILEDDEWKTRTGKIKINKMTDKHLINAFHFLCAYKFHFSKDIMFKIFYKNNYPHGEYELCKDKNIPYIVIHNPDYYISRMWILMKEELIKRKSLRNIELLYINPDKPTLLHKILKIFVVK